MKKINQYVDHISDTKIKKNIKLFPIYYMFACDYLFFYAIEYVFLAQVKNFSGSQILLLDSLIPLFCILLNIPLTLFVEEIGKKKSLVIRKFMYVFLFNTSYNFSKYIWSYYSFLFQFFGILS